MLCITGWNSHHTSHINSPTTSWENYTSCAEQQHMHIPDVLPLGVVTPLPTYLLYVLLM